MINDRKDRELGREIDRWQMKETERGKGRKRRSNDECLRICEESGKIRELEERKFNKMYFLK